MEGFEDIARLALGLGLDGQELGAAQMAARAAVVYVVTVLMVRLAKKRFMGRATAFDVILGIMLGSVVSRAITGNAPFGPALAAGAVLLAMHWTISAVAFRWRGFGIAVKGRARLLIRDGTLDRKAMRAAHVTEHDIWEDLRRQGISRLGQVREACLERSGDLSVIRTEPEPRVLSVTVAEGVQTVRVELR